MAPPENRPAVALSACLGGQAVRYDGADKRHALVLRHLDGPLCLLPVCPEVEAGLPVPRPPVQLVVADGATRVLGRDDPALEVTQALRATARASVRRLLASAPLCGWIWQSRSPSCGLGSTPRFDASGRALAPGYGIQAGYVARHYPWLLCVEDTALNSAADCARFARACTLLFEVVYAQPQRPLAAWRDDFAALYAGLPQAQRAAVEGYLQKGQRRRWAGAMARVIWWNAAG